MAEFPAPFTFKGLRNQANPRVLDPGCLSRAEDVIVTPQGMVDQRWGHGAGLGFSHCTDLYSPVHLRYGFLVANGTLYQFNDGVTAANAQVLATGLVDGEYKWASTPVGDNTFLAGPTEAMWIQNGRLLPLKFPDVVAPQVDQLAGSMPPGVYQITQIYRHKATGMLGGMAPTVNFSVDTPSGFLITTDVPSGYEAEIYVSAADSYVEKLLTTLPLAGMSVLYDHDPSALIVPSAKPNINAWPFPDGECAGLAWRGGYLYAGVWNPASNLTRIYQSREWQYHLWEHDAWDEDQTGAKLVGKLIQMIGLDEGLLVATDAMVGIISSDMKTLNRLAGYGCPPGRPMAQDAWGVAVHTKRGLVTFPPFDASGQAKFTPNPGSAARVFLGQAQGIRFAQVQTDGHGAPFNQYT